MVKLNPKQQAFVQEYLIDLNATQAAIRAGYAERTAYSQGQRLLKHVEIQAAIQKAQLAREKRTEVTADQVIKQLAKIAFHDIRDVVIWGEGGHIRIKAADEIDGTVLQEISESVTDSGNTCRVKLNDRMKALELLGRHMGLFTDNVKLSGEVGVKIIDDIE